MIKVQPTCIKPEFQLNSAYRCPLMVFISTFSGLKGFAGPGTLIPFIQIILPDEMSSSVEKFTKVIWVSGIGPQTAVHNAAFAGRIGFKFCQLPIPNRFEHKTGRPNNSTQAIEPSKSGGCLSQLTDLNHKRDNP